MEGWGGLGRSYNINSNNINSNWWGEGSINKGIGLRSCEHKHWRLGEEVVGVALQAGVKFFN